MALTSGSRLGPYEVVAAVGAGGMGEVYRARDTRLNRDVALKVLPELFARDRERISRFEREAQLLAALNHPRIAAIYSLEESGHVSALVLEFVEGPTLADRLERGALPVDEALPLADQLADALSAAHDKGIVHRDLKPSNIKICPDGTVKILDFGIAKALESAPAGRGESMSLPTITTPAMTARGVVLGTAAYMSPEQARGLPVGTAADIWAFGCVLFEMLTGTRPFVGVDTTETLAAILRAEPEWSRLPPVTPEPIRRLLRRCLRKDEAHRLADIRDARLDIDDARHAVEPAPPTTGGSRRELVLWAAVVALLGLVAAAFVFRRSSLDIPPPREMRVEVSTPPTTDPVSIAVSPDGETIAMVASSGSRSQLWLRSMTTGSMRALKGTDGASFPFWSPDSRSLAFFSGERLYRIDLDGELPRPIGHAPVGAGGTWGRDGTILYVLVPDAPLMRIRAEGGPPTPLIPPMGSPTVRQGERFPKFFPDGRHFLFYVAESRGVFLGQLDSPERRRLLDADATAVPASAEELLFVRQGTLYAQRIDPATFTMTGEPAALAEHVPVDPRGVAALSASSTGTVIYRTGVSSQQRQLVWVERSGKPRGAADEPDFDLQWNPALSPDGRTVALTRSVQGNTDVWLLDLDRKVRSRLTSDPLPDIYPTWSPKGTHVAFAKPSGAGAFGVFVQPTTSRAEPRLYRTAAPAIPLDWSEDGRYLLCRSGEPQTGWRLIALDLQDGSTIVPVTDAKFEAKFGQFSPDGRFVAYEANETGHIEVFVQSFPAGEGKKPISRGGGTQALWREDGEELFYISSEGQLMAVPVTSPAKAATIEFGPATTLFQTGIESTSQGGVSHQYAPSADGKTFLMNNFIEQTGAPITVLLHRARR